MIPDSNGGLHELAEGGFEMGIRNIKDLISRYPEKQFFVLLDYPWSKDSYTALANLNRLRKLFKSTLNNRLHRNLACVIDKSSRGAKLERAFEELP